MNAPAMLTRNVAHGHSPGAGGNHSTSAARATAPAKPPAKMAATSRRSIRIGRAGYLRPSAERSALAGGCAEDAVARVAEAGADVAVGVELAVQRGRPDRDVGMAGVDRLDALGSADQADEPQGAGPPGR